MAAGTLEIGGSGGYQPSQAGGAVTVSNGAAILISTVGYNALPFQFGTPAWQVGGTINVTGGAANTISSGGVVLNGGTLTSTTGEATYGAFFYNTGNGIVTANGSGNSISSVDFGIYSALALTLNTPLAGDSLVASTQFKDVSGSGSLLKTGAGTVTLTGTSTYSGSTTVGNGTLLVNGSIDAGVTVTGGTLGGIGAINGAASVEAGGRITGGAVAALGTLTLNNDLNLNGDVWVKLDKSQAPSNSVISVSGQLAANSGATLTITNLGPALQLGDKFYVFNRAFDAGGGDVTITNAQGYGFSNDLDTDGSITVTSVPSLGQPTLGYSKSGNNLTFTWDGTGSLEWQTNALNKGLSTNWVAYPNGTNGVTVTVDPTQPSVFFRVKR